MENKLISDFFNNPFAKRKQRENHENHEDHENRVSTTGAVSSTRAPTAFGSHPGSQVKNPGSGSAMGAARQVVEAYNKPTATDPTGSSTGVPQAKNEVPVQDADDL
jgi:hypothetical protein